MNILVTGGAGFIGSHTLIELITAGHSVVVVDNLSNANPESLRRVESITGQGVPFYKVDIRDREGLSRVFALHNFDCYSSWIQSRGMWCCCGILILLVLMRLG